MTEQPPRQHERVQAGTDEPSVTDDAMGRPAQDPLDVDNIEHPTGAAVVEVEDTRSREELLAELSDATSRRDEYLDDLRRARAEFENYRRRMMRENAMQRDNGRADIASAVLEVLDDLDRTLDAAAGSPDDQLVKGVELVASKLRGSLESQGLVRIDGTDVPFDPQKHEAVQHHQADEPREQPTVVEILRPGYQWGDKVLRAAMVVVEG